MSDKIRVGIITENPPTALGGVERFTLSLMQGLREKNFEVKIFDKTVINNWKTKWYDRFGIEMPRFNAALGKEVSKKYLINR